MWFPNNPPRWTAQVQVTSRVAKQRLKQALGKHTLVSAIRATHDLVLVEERLRCYNKNVCLLATSTYNTLLLHILRVWNINVPFQELTGQINFASY